MLIKLPVPENYVLTFDSVQKSAIHNLRMEECEKLLNHNLDANNHVLNIQRDAVMRARISLLQELLNSGD